MLILAIGVSTMITVAVVVLGMQYFAYRRNRVERGKVCGMQGTGIEGIRHRSTRNEPAARGTQEVPIPS